MGKENKLTNLKDAYKIAKTNIFTKQSPSRSKEVSKATSSVIKKTPDQFRSDVKMDRDIQSAKLSQARRSGVAQPPSEFSVGRNQAKGMGAGLLKDIKRKMMKHIPGRLKKTY